MTKREKKNSNKVVITIVLIVIWVAITQSLVDSTGDLISTAEWIVVVIITYVMAVIWYQLMSRK